MIQLPKNRIPATPRRADVDNFGPKNWRLALSCDMNVVSFNLAIAPRKHNRHALESAGGSLL